MTMRSGKTLVQGVLLALAFILGMSGVSQGAEYWLRAEVLTKTMPDGNVITMWGFAQCDDGTYATCSPATVPGPAVTVPAADTSLTIHLRNNLTGPFVEPVSIVIPGQTITPAPVRNADGRVRSFTAETPADNSTTVDYIWSSLKPGTYLYQSGTHPAVQVQMGLYGAMTKDAAAGEAYGPATSYEAEAILLFSEIDPVLHINVAMGNYGPGQGMTSTFDYEPKYFLINGEPYSSSTGAISAGAAGQNVLLRFLNAGLKHRAPTLNGLFVSLVAEDGNPYPNAREQYSLLLSPGKTIDARIAAAPAGYFPVFDRRMGVTNAASGPGGMIQYVKIDGAQAVLTTGVTGSGTITASGIPGGINCGTDCSESYNVGTSVTLSAVPDAGYTLTGWACSGGDCTACTGTGDCVVGMTADASVTATFQDMPVGTVVINGGAAATSNRQVTLTLSATDASTAVTNMRLSWDNMTWGSWLVYAATRTVWIPAGDDGIKTVYVQFRDASGTASIPYSDSIVLDRTSPTGSVVLNSGEATTTTRQVTLTLNGTDSGSGVTDMRFSWDHVTWTSWRMYAAATNVTVPAGADGVKTIYVKFRDAAGNVSPVYSDSIVLDREAPTGSVEINSGAATTATRQVTLTLNATDPASGVTGMRFSWDHVTWTNWQIYSPTKDMNIPAGPAGTKTIYVKFRDAAGNVSTVYSDTIDFTP